MAFGIGTFAIWFAVSSPLERIAFGQESSARFASVDSAVFASFHFSEHVAYGRESGCETSGGG
eukprot:3442551-Pleurochrysis_carterae.AAC.1